jgi:23S rRNA pseudouridine1911/1915/1917 synthase
MEADRLGESSGARPSARLPEMLRPDLDASARIGGSSGRRGPGRVAAGETLFARLRGLFPQSSGRSLKRWLASGRVLVNGRVTRDGRAPIGPTDRIRLGRPAGPPCPAPLQLVHEDGQILVVDKPAGLLTIATERERQRTAYRLAWDYLAGQRPPRRPFVVHRLDRETSGLLVFAKSPTAKRHLQAQFEARTVERIYLAAVEGRVRADRGTLESWIGQDRHLRVRTVGQARRDGDGRARLAIASYRVLERRRDITLLELRLGTGRRQQIRVQLADLGHPIVGDPVHGRPPGSSRRLCLHATRLGFVHPVTGRLVRFESRPPAMFGRPIRSNPFSCRTGRADAFPRAPAHRV